MTEDNFGGCVSGIAVMLVSFLGMMLSIMVKDLNQRMDVLTFLVMLIINYLQGVI